jgi:uncharacterized cupredoxin-like copper-binding protein
MRGHRAAVALVAALVTAGTLTGTALAATKVAIAKSDSAKHTADLTMIAGLGTSGSGFDFNGYSKGKMTVTVPLGWKVNVKFEVPAKSTLAHSWVLVPYGAAMGSTSTPAIAGAESPSPTQGTKPGTTVTISFTAKTAGKYRMICAVPGHEMGGMWDTLIVKKGATAATSTPADTA